MPLPVSPSANKVVGEESNDAGRIHIAIRADKVQYYTKASCTILQAMRALYNLVGVPTPPTTSIVTSSGTRPFMLSVGEIGEPALLLSDLVVAYLHVYLINHTAINKIF